MDTYKATRIKGTLKGRHPVGLSRLSLQGGISDGSLTPCLRDGNAYLRCLIGTGHHRYPIVLKEGCLVGGGSIKLHQIVASELLGHGERRQVRPEVAVG